jgi:hypothetical protein
MTAISVILDDDEFESAKAKLLSAGLWRVVG